jgi:hypothetical protein
MKIKSFGTGLLVLLLGTSAFAGETKYSPGEIQSRMNQIYYWHLAEELNISAEQEKGMVKILENSQKRRSELLSVRDESVTVLQAFTGKPANYPSDAALANALKNYEKVTHELAHTDKDEFDSLRKLFGDQALARFLVVRDSITERLRNSIRKAPASESSR